MEKQKIIETIEHMTVLELSELITALEEKFGVSATMPMVMNTAGSVNYTVSVRSGTIMVCNGKSNTM